MPARAALLLLWTALGCGDAVAAPIRGAQSLVDAAMEGRGRFQSGGPEVPDLAHCADADDWPAELAAAELQLFAAINARRAQGIRCREGDGDGDGNTQDRQGEREREPLALVPELRCSARLHSLDMHENDYVGRENLAGDDFRDRIRATGLDAGYMDESIEWSDAGPDDVLADLLEDPDDCGNLVNSELNAVGIGHYGQLWTLDFAEL
jgi:hypothetical protein